MADHDRPLSARGRRAAASMRQAMRGLGLDPDVVLVSTAARTLQTLEALEPWDETPLVEPMDGLYLASANQLLQILRGVADTVRSVLVVGHNPGLHDLAKSLAVTEGGAAAASTDLHRLIDAFPTGALAEFAVPGPWSTLAPGGASLLRLINPRDLPDVSAVLS